MKRNSTYLGFLVIAISVGITAWGIKASQGIRSETRGITGAVEDMRSKQIDAAAQNDAVSQTVSNLNQRIAARVDAASSRPGVQGPPLGTAEWNTGEAFVDLPKSLLK